jgi:hypothetical protein
MQNVPRLRSVKMNGAPKGRLTAAVNGAPAPKFGWGVAIELNEGEHVEFEGPAGSNVEVIPTPNFPAGLDITSPTEANNTKRITNNGVGPNDRDKAYPFAIEIDGIQLDPVLIPR